MTFGENMRRKRIEKGLTQLQLAQMTELSQPIIAQYERGSKQPIIPTASAIAKALDCTVDELLRE